MGRLEIIIWIVLISACVAIVVGAIAGLIGMAVEAWEPEFARLKARLRASREAR